MQDTTFTQFFPSEPSDASKDAETVASLDLAYQAAVKANDFETMDSILHEQFAMVYGDGRVIGREELLESARSAERQYDIQDEDPGTQAVRVWGDTAVVTACLHVKGMRAGEAFDRRVWFSDTYVRSAGQWRYAFAQVSLPLPA